MDYEKSIFHPANQAGEEHEDIKEEDELADDDSAD